MGPAQRRHFCGHSAPDAGLRRAPGGLYHASRTPARPLRRARVRALLVALFTPAAPGWPWYWRWAKNLVAAPLAAVFPAGRALAAMADPADVALRALEPYLDAKGLVKGGRERAGLAVAKRGELIAFGVAAAAISALPIVSWVTMFTTAAGAALWAADLEAAGRLAR